MIEWLAAHLTAALGANGLAGLFLAMLLESACIPLPSEVVLPFAGILVGQGVYGFWAALFWAVAGQMTGSLLTHSLGRYGGRPFLLRHRRYLPFRPHELARAENWFARYGEVTVLAGRLLPGVRTFISLPAGMSDMPLRRFLPYSVLGALPWTAGLILAGVKVGKLWENPVWDPYFRFAEAVVALTVLVAVVYYLIRRASDRPRS